MAKVLSAPRASVRPLPTPYSQETGVPAQGLSNLGGAIKQASTFAAQEYARKKAGEEHAIDMGAEVELERAYTDLFMGTADTTGFSDLDWHGAREGVGEYQDSLRAKKEEVLSRVPEALRTKVGVSLDRLETVYRRKAQLQLGQMQTQNKNASRQALTENAMAIFATNPMDDLQLEAAELKIDKAVEGFDPEIAQAAKRAQMAKGYGIALQTMIQMGTPEAISRVKALMDREDIRGALNAYGRYDNLKKQVDAVEAGNLGNQLVMDVMGLDNMSDETGRPIEDNIYDAIASADTTPDVKAAAQKQADVMMEAANRRVDAAIAEYHGGFNRGVTSEYQRTGLYSFTPAIRANIEALAFVDPQKAREDQAWLDTKIRIQSNRWKARQPGPKSAKARATLQSNLAKEADDRDKILMDIANDPQKYQRMSDQERMDVLRDFHDKSREKVRNAIIGALKRGPAEFGATASTLRESDQMLKDLNRWPANPQTKNAAKEYLLVAIPKWVEKEGRQPNYAEKKAILDRGFDSGEVVGTTGFGMGRDMPRMEAARKYPKKVFLSDEQVKVFDEKYAADFKASRKELDDGLRARGLDPTAENRMDVYVRTLIANGEL